MRTNYTNLKANDFVKSTVEGTLDLEKTIGLLKKLIRRSKRPDHYRVLLDLRSAECEFSMVDLIELCDWLVEFSSPEQIQKIAVLIHSKTEPDTEKAEFLENCAFNRGFDIRVFTALEDAEAWLEQE